MPSPITPSLAGTRRLYGRGRSVPKTLSLGVPEARTWPTALQTKASNLRRLGQFDKARASALSAVETVRAGKWTRYSCALHPLNNLGAIALATRHFAEAAGYFERIVGIVARQKGDDWRLALPLANFAIAEANLGDLPKAANCWKNRS